MRIWQSGRESALLDDIIAGRKTIEGRLNKGKFAKYRVGDRVLLRRDVRGDDGVLRDGTPNAASVEIAAIRHYPDFKTMVIKEGFHVVIPSANSAEEAVSEYDKYYSLDDQQQYGVLAIEVSLYRQTDSAEDPVIERAYSLVNRFDDDFKSLAKRGSVR